MITLDFEARAGRHPRDNVLVYCAACHTTTQGSKMQYWDLRTLEGQNELYEWLWLYPEEIYVMFNSMFDLPCLYQLGFYPTRVIDMYPECKQFTLTHPGYRTSETNLLSMCKEFGVTHRYADEKDAVRDIIIHNTQYTDEQMELIEDYNGADVEATWGLYNALTKLWDKWGITEAEALNRGEFCIAQATSYYNTKGFPIDVELLNCIEDNSELICNEVREACNRSLGLEIYKKKVRKRDGYTSYSFNHSSFATLLGSVGLTDSWNKTETGRLSTCEKDILQAIEGFASDYKNILMDLHYAMGMVKILSKKQDKLLSNYLTSNGHTNPPPFPFHQKTSRSSPKPSLGFILNLIPFLRCLIQPKPGKAFVGCDWGKQEMIIAGSLSGDQAYLEGVHGDVYMETAKLLGPKYCPADATKKTHPDLRQKMKGITLGIGYGKQVPSLSVDMSNLFGVNPTEGRQMAEGLMNAHKLKYAKYWTWIKSVLADSRPGVPIRGKVRSPVVGAYVTLDGWYYFTDKNVRPTQLQNVPCQSTGAAILRRGFIHAVNNGLDVVCSLHDALYINCDIDAIDASVSLLKSCMRLAVEDILGKGVVIGNEEKIVMEGKHYLDERGIKMLKDLVSRTEAVPELNERLKGILDEKDM